MIHPGLNKTEVAFRYYSNIKPHTYNREQARKQFQQDRHIDMKVLKFVIDQIFKEQKQIFKQLPNC